MKKSLLITLFAFLSLSLFSQKIKVESGSLDFLKNETAINVKFTYEDMKVGKKTESDYVNEKIEKFNKDQEGKGDTWYKKWVADRTERFEPKFIELYNKQMSEKNGAIITADAANYTMSVNTHFTEPGFNVAVARKNAEVSVECIFTNNQTGEEIAVVLVEKSSANDFWGSDFDTAYRIQESYAKAGRELAKFIIKQLKIK